MLGTIINAAAIAFGCLFGLASARRPSTATQNYLKLLLGAAAIFTGFRLVWLALNGEFAHVLKQTFVVFLALMLGRGAGKLLGLQKISNRLGQSARKTVARVSAGQTPAWSDGFNTCAILFCAAPLAALGSVADGLGDHFEPLVIKAVMEGLAALGFAAMFRWSVALTALPVFVYQGTVTLVCAQYARPFLEQRGLLDSVLLADGLLIVFIGLMILEIRKIEMADYLPALVLAPLFTRLML
ncbi:MAG: hypothetical protein RLZZ350_496 [Verrucomicrobiota bacterium]|jgi:uncharacterized membrane protein YqgA involved in biofilm formation